VFSCPPKVKNYHEVNLSFVSNNMYLCVYFYELFSSQEIVRLPAGHKLLLQPRGLGFSLQKGAQKLLGGAGNLQPFLYT
jgi:hypothetical protein